MKSIQRRVVSASAEGICRVRQRGRWRGIYFACELECGHSACTRIRWFKGNDRTPAPPKRLACRECWGCVACGRPWKEKK